MHWQSLRYAVDADCSLCVRPFMLENKLRSSRRQLSDNHGAFRKQSLFTYFRSPQKQKIIDVAIITGACTKWIR